VDSNVAVAVEASVTVAVVVAVAAAMTDVVGVCIVGRIETKGVKGTAVWFEQLVSTSIHATMIALHPVWFAKFFSDGLISARPSLVTLSYTRQR
jgi:hypothetical protein